MGRPVARPLEALPPSSWPAWVLNPPGGLTDTPEAMTAAHERFHQWRIDRAAWVRAHRPDLATTYAGHPSLGPFLAEAQTERRRRTLHTEQD